MLAQKQPPFKECVIAHWSRGSAPKMTGAKVQNRSRGKMLSILGRGAFYTRRRYTVRSAGEYGSENAGMSSEKNSENLFHRKPKVS
jgi:hypothetical protein